jgi:OCT family organic cation transporter-like MFS transporter 18
LEPFLVDKLTLSATGSKESSNKEYASLQSFFSLVQTLGSLCTGYLIDRVGAKVGFLINFVACALSYYLLSISTTMNILYLSKVPTVFQAGFLCAQAMATRITDDGAERVSALSRLSLSYMLGMVCSNSSL